MFNASYFTYDDICSAEYGLMIADFDDSSVVETAAFSPSLNTYKPSISNRLFHGGIVYDTNPTHQFSVISQQVIPDVIRREVLTWLVGRSEFKKLVIHQPDLEEYWYNCVFTNVDIIYVHGNCHGFRLTANFDSPYQYGRPSSVTVTGSGESQIVTITNKSDIIDNYTYPIVRLSGSGLNIVNKTDDASRSFSLSGFSSNGEIIVDNEIKYIQNSSGGKCLAGFNKNWLRLRRGVNELEIAVDGTCTITCPTYVMMGF